MVQEGEDLLSLSGSRGRSLFSRGGLGSSLRSSSLGLHRLVCARLNS